MAMCSFRIGKSLELRGCDHSTSAPRGLLKFWPVSEKLICHTFVERKRFKLLGWERKGSVLCTWIFLKVYLWPSDVNTYVKLMMVNLRPIS